LQVDGPSRTAKPLSRNIDVAADEAEFPRVSVRDGFAKDWWQRINISHLKKSRKSSENSRPSGARLQACHPNLG
jgi:hypothetical protein